MMKFIAGCIDDFLIHWYTYWGGADEPCGKLQTWARQARAGDGYDATIKAKNKIRSDI